MNSLDLGNGQGAGAPGNGALVVDSTTKDFGRDVIEESRNQPVLVDFWAPWCGPCKTLGPTIEKAVTEAKGAVKLVKLNIDDHPAIAGQMGIQSIPAVIAFVDGQPVDGFTGAVPESHVKAFIEKVGGPAGPSAAEQLVTTGEALLEAGDLDAAGQHFVAALQQEPDSVPAIVGVARMYLAQDDTASAREALERVPESAANDTAVVAAQAQLHLAEQTANVGDADALRARIDANPADLEARFDLALVANSKNEREEATDQLLDIIARNRSWQDEKARKQLVEFFEAWGPTDEATLSGRRRLSSILFA
jgi:putative thioredoxin